MVKINTNALNDLTYAPYPPPSPQWGEGKGEGDPTGGMAMKCYVCAKQGVDKDAVAICIVCGMGLCLGHAFKEELLVRDIIDWGFGEERIEYPHTLPRFICAECKLAREQRMRVERK
jgi:hypothetical protein